MTHKRIDELKAELAALEGRPQQQQQAGEPAIDPPITDGERKSYREWVAYQRQSPVGGDPGSLEEYVRINRIFREALGKPPIE
jgi:hypothetical protein